MQLPTLSHTETNQKISMGKLRESGSSTADSSVLIPSSGIKELLPGSEYRI